MGENNEDWKGKDFYFSFGHGEYRSWKDSRRYGFVSAGQGEWYTKPLENLFEGCRIFVRIPGEGYVGVGKVITEVIPVTEFTVEYEEEETPILEVLLYSDSMKETADNPEEREQLLGVDWIKTRDIEDAIHKKGMFANQRTVCRLKDEFTINQLIDEFSI